MITLDHRILICCVGSMVGTIITPDLDVDKNYIGDKIVEERVGWIGKRVWVWFWKPYKTSFKHGRFASHFPLFSSFVRLAYLYFMLILPFYAVYFLTLHSWNYNTWLMQELMFWVTIFLNPYFFYGLASSDLIHYALDKMTKNVE